MKRFLFAVSSLLAISTLNSQTNYRLLPTYYLVDMELQTEHFVKPTNVSVEKTLGTTVWSDDFSTPSNWTIDNSGINASGFGWEIGTNNNGWYFSQPINSSSDGNFAELNNGDPLVQSQAMDVVYSLTTVNPIDITSLAGTNNVFLSFLQYGARFDDAQEIYISLDGNSWILVGDNSDIDALTNSSGSVFANPTLKTIDLGGVLMGQNASAVYIRFSWTTANPSSGSDPMVWVTYGWMIDDVSISTKATNDLIISESYFTMGAEELSYGYIPVSQISPMTFHSDIINNGSVSQTGVAMELLIGGASVSTGDVQSVLPVTDTYSTLLEYTPPCEEGIVNYTSNAFANETEEIPSDNSEASSFTITSSHYAMHNGIIKSTFSNIASEPEGTLRIGNKMEIFEEGIIDKMYIRLGSNSTNIGQEFFGEIWRYNGIEFELVGMTNDVTISTGTNNKMVEVPLMSPIAIFAGDILLVFAGHYAGSNGVDFGLAQYVPDGSVVGISDGGTAADLFTISNPRAIMVGVNIERMILTSAVETVSQNICLGNPIVPVTIFCLQNPIVDLGNFPAGITGSYNSSTHIYTLSGTPTATIGVIHQFTGEITPVSNGVCGGDAQLVELIVSAPPAVYLTSVVGSDSQIVDVDSLIIPIVYTISGSATDLVLTSGVLPAGLSGTLVGNVYTISGAPTSAIGSPYNFTLQTVGAYCGSVQISGLIWVNEVEVNEVKEKKNNLYLNGNLFPNPATKQTELNYSVAKASDIRVSITDITGKLIFIHKEEKLSSGEYSLVIDTTSFTSGVYYLTLTDGENQVMRKLIRR